MSCSFLWLVVTLAQGDDSCGQASQAIDDIGHWTLDIGQAIDETILR